MAGFELTGIDGRVFRATDEGDGKAVLLVHGGCNGPEDWNRVARSTNRNWTSASAQGAAA